MNTLREYSFAFSIPQLYFALIVKFWSLFSIQVGYSSYSHNNSFIYTVLSPSVYPTFILSFLNRPSLNCFPNKLLELRFISGLLLLLKLKFNKMLHKMEYHYIPRTYMHDPWAWAMVRGLPEGAGVLLGEGGQRGKIGTTVIA